MNLKLGLVTACVAALALTLVATGFGATAYKTTVIINPDLNTLHGRLESSKHACVKGRTVRLYDRRTAHPDTPVGQPATSNKYGRWQIDHTGDPYPDTYAAYVKAIQAEHPNFVCKGAHEDLGAN